MTKDELKKLDDDLAQEEKVIRNQLSSIAKENPLVKGDFDVVVEDLGKSQEDAAQEAGDLDRDQALVDALERRLKEITSTRQKIKSGKYGKCDNCASEISVARLKAMPVASLCISCAQKPR
ncbi:MAG: hypothetical protein A3B99_02300 [Candidatus Yanofskybacteria bacterium RIFCSPHIGHO2_02_FULL_44_12b]|uniref:Zinc finger DksA/TraR C4-type domain-containing protein n=3 Tax=Patescibacteria group TaxID=1783273 RepID=A0A1F7WK22_9BACT|nr:MAG: DnaK suppressor protein [Candidatus Yanofskybacteria bacterium GW2011_GWA2_44_9]OGM02769.1 MAG: hypothetical protein A2115_01665 [Candidatus Woesebacteria bacterium GWA1_41_8]OGN05533.1 MAG: hypothetical protein A2659_03000 [Candidatus Yanofskybacteria bacterium RIFCSPHIGHO2_01_FULL_44_24]OGN14616.1 MAG: hypothetical protein A3B99_02300 [Candidatus Yanofskybacteria bacterium RIFCSPHIGHO2_02_FULL_44_12b]OGN26552.1 MAG: hypothetical protein A2925_03365 [Candidatus Yanofskybacteria bacteri